MPVFSVLVRHRVVHYLKWKKLADSVCDDFIGSLAQEPSRNDPILLDTAGMEIQ